MNLEKKQMIDSLKRIFIPEIRKLGFKGSFPHFRKTENVITNLLTFQFDRNGGGFVIEIANHAGNEFKTSWDKVIPLSKLTAHDLYIRKRIYPETEEEPNGTYDWFRYDIKANFDELSCKAILKIPAMEKYWMS